MSFNEPKKLIVAANSANRDIGVSLNHGLISATTGAGKTIALNAYINSILVQFARCTEIMQPLIIVIDPKQVSFQALRMASREGGRLADRVRVISDYSKFSAVPEALFDEHNRRVGWMADNQAEDLPLKDFGRIFLIIDESASVIGNASVLTKTARTSFTNSLSQVCGMGRQSNMTVMLTVLGAVHVPPDLRSLLNVRVMMHAQNRSEPEMMMPGTNIEELRLDTLRPGEAWFADGGDPQRGWFDHVTNERLAAAIEALPDGLIQPDHGFLDRRGLWQI